MNIDEMYWMLERLYEGAYRKGYDQAMKDMGITEKEMEDIL